MIEGQSCGLERTDNIIVGVLGTKVYGLISLPRPEISPGGQERGTGSAAAVSHVRVNEHLFDFGNLENPLVQLHVRRDATGQGNGINSRTVNVMANIIARNDLECALIRRGNIDLRK